MKNIVLILTMLVANLFAIPLTFQESLIQNLIAVIIIITPFYLIVVRPAMVQNKRDFDKAKEK